MEVRNVKAETPEAFLHGQQPGAEQGGQNN
jgi:hypothetical protein